VEERLSPIVKKTISKILLRLSDITGYNISITRKSVTQAVPNPPKKPSVSSEPITNAPSVPYVACWQDGLMSQHNKEFLTDERFVRAYQRGMKAANGVDWKWHWRVHVGLWAAQTCSTIEGDYVECGVGPGFLSSAIMEYLSWNKLSKHFYLFDTFEGLDEKYLTSQELKKVGTVESWNKRMVEEGIYCSNYQSVEENFREWNRVHLIKGAVPGTLSTVSIPRVAYMNIDMNCAIPEVAAIEHFYPKLTMGAIVLFDDYGYSGYEEQKKAIDSWASKVGVAILSLPTGQGMLVKTELQP
jgi:hypothetical protein